MLNKADLSIFSPVITHEKSFSIRHNGSTIPMMLKVYQGQVQPGWVDYNQHMNVAYYTMAFDHATDAAFEEWGIGKAYCTVGKHSLFAVEQHIVYDRELTVGAPFEVITYPVALGRKTLI